ncbi:MAG: PrsW family intramembrane metalloprotease [Lentisphaeria bacterium]|nr:PrsW family intramembrane metalloprotease [Lentisphaeria bacterium]
MSKLSFTCPNCGQKFIDIEGIEPHQKIECGQCHFQFDVPSESENISDNASINMQAFNAVEQETANRPLGANCPKCGNAILPNAQFCGYCGEPLQNKQENQPPVTAIDEDLSNKGNRLFANALGVEKLEGFSFSKFFVQTFKHHSWDEMEEIVAVGTKSTTPELSSVSTEWPTPWFFFRVILFVIVAYLIVLWRRNDLEEYALMIQLLLGIIGMPLAALSFFFEINILKNVSVMQVGKLVCVGGFISCLATLLVSRVIKFESPIWAGPIEELIKGGVMLLFIRNPRYHYKLNGLLVGASIGVGFAIIETAGYVVRSNNFEFIMFIRAFAAPLCHVLYSSLVGYALWEARANGIFTFEALVKGKTLRLIALAIVLHMFWNSNFLLNELIIKCIIVAIIGYSSVIYLLQDCIKEIRLKKQMIE